MNPVVVQIPANRLRSGVRRAVIDNMEFPVRIGLAANAIDGQRQISGHISRWNYDGDCHSQLQVIESSNILTHLRERSIALLPPKSDFLNERPQSYLRQSK